MTEVPSRELRNDTAGVLRRVEAGEEITVTVNGRPVAELRPVGRRPRWMSKEDFLRNFQQADPGLAKELREMLPETTDDLPWR
jgi:prevent-host-death family protein